MGAGRRTAQKDGGTAPAGSRPVKKILIVEDEPTLVATLKYNLEREGYNVKTAVDGEAGLSSARAQRPDLIVLDLMLPGLDGFEVCRIIRRESATPILMLTAKTDEVDKVVGLELGADDYVTKPFSMRELLARVRALLRRAEQAPQTDQDVLASGNLLVDVAKRQASRAGQPLPLKPKEYELLVFLLRNPGRVFTRDQLLNQIWGYDFVGDSRTVDVHMRWLRQKIEDEPSKPVRLITVRGTGYRFEG
jgi:DNA-binding response OmpR family regulator